MQYDFVPLFGPSNGPGETHQVNNRGDVAGSVYLATDILGAVWQTSGLIELPEPADAASYLWGINDVGDAVGVRAIFNSPTEVPIYFPNGSAAAQDLSAVLGVGAVCTDINNDRVICGWSYERRGFIYIAGSNTLAAKIDGLPGATTAGALAINQPGDVAGTSTSGQSTHGIVFSKGAYSDLGPAAFVTDINNSRQVVGSIGKAFPQNFAPAFWDAGQKSPVNVEEIPVPPGFGGGHAEAINNQGAIVGSCWTLASYNGDQTAFLYDGTNSVDLNTVTALPSGWHLQFATGVNDKGQIAGWGSFNGQRTGFLLVPKPYIPSIPSGIIGLVLGGIPYDGSGIVILPGSPPIPVGPWGPMSAWSGLSEEKRQVLIGLAIDQLALSLNDVAARQSIRGRALEDVRAQVNALIRGSQADAPAMGAMRALPAQLKSGKSEHALRVSSMLSPSAVSIRGADAAHDGR